MSENQYGKVAAVAITDSEVIVLGTPAEDQDEEAGHNCDAMGCTSLGDHVLWRGPLAAAKALTRDPRSDAASGPTHQGRPR